MYKHRDGNSKNQNEMLEIKTTCWAQSDVNRNLPSWKANRKKILKRASKNCGIFSKGVTYTYLEYQREKKENWTEEISALIMPKNVPNLMTDTELKIQVA